MTRTLVVIPTLSLARASLAAHSLGALEGDFSGLVVTNGALPTQLAALPAGWAHAHEKTPGLLAGRQYPLHRTDAEVIVYLDDDVTIPAGWAAKILEPFADPEVHFVGCRYLPDYEHAPPVWMAGLWWSRDDGFRTLGDLSLLDGGPNSRLYSAHLVWGLCFAVRRKTVIKLGGFNPDGYPWDLRRYRGDGENGLAAKAQVLGLKAFYQGQTHVMHAVPASRMTPAYFEQRAFLQGVSDSYTEIRTQGASPAVSTGSWKGRLRPLRSALQRVVTGRVPTEARIRRLMARAYMAGRTYHRDEVGRDPQLLDWVLRLDYQDGALPTGWESYLGKGN